MKSTRSIITAFVLAFALASGLYRLWCVLVSGPYGTGRTEWANAPVGCAVECVTEVSRA